LWQVNGHDRFNSPDPTDTPSREFCSPGGAHIRDEESGSRAEDGGW
jgi:hypothetical protein